MPYQPASSPSYYSRGKSPSALAMFCQPSPPSPSRGTSMLLDLLPSMSDFTLPDRIEIELRIEIER
jgi:hypothetical protein